MIRETEKIMIEDIEYAYDPEKEYIKDGHAYCEACHDVIYQIKVCPFFQIK